MGTEGMLLGPETRWGCEIEPLRIDLALCRLFVGGDVGPCFLRAIVARVA